MQYFFRALAPSASPNSNTKRPNSFTHSALLLSAQSLALAAAAVGAGAGGGGLGVGRGSVHGLGGRLGGGSRRGSSRGSLGIVRVAVQVVVGGGRRVHVLAVAIRGHGRVGGRGRRGRVRDGSRERNDKNAMLNHLLVNGLRPLCLVHVRFGDVK